MKLAIGLVIACLAFSATSAQAWTDNSSGENCSFAQLFEGPGSSLLTFLSNEESRDNRFFAIGDHNENWSISENDKLSDLKVMVNGIAYSHGIVAVDHGFAIMMPESEINNFETAKSFVVLKGDQVIDRLGIADATVSFITFKACISNKRAEKESAMAEQKRKEAISKLPIDPFAKAPH